MIIFLKYDIRCADPWQGAAQRDRHKDHWFFYMNKYIVLVFGLYNIFAYFLIRCISIDESILCNSRVTTTVVVCAIGAQLDLHSNPICWHLLNKWIMHAGSHAYSQGHQESIQADAHTKTRQSQAYTHTSRIITLAQIHSQLLKSTLCHCLWGNDKMFNIAIHCVTKCH